MKQDHLGINEESILDEEGDEYFKAKECNKGLRMVLLCTLPLVLIFLVGLFYFISVIEVTSKGQ